MFFPFQLGLRMFARRESRPGRAYGNRRRAAFRPQLEALEDRRLLSAGDLDLSFSGDGWTTQSLSANATEKYPDYADHVYIGTDGKILVGASWFGEFGLIRLTPAGDLDPTFGTGGRVRTDPDDNTQHHYDMALQADGKIVVVGDIDKGYLVNGHQRVYNSDISVVRYNANGSLDSTFGTGGIVETNISTYGNDTPNDTYNKDDKALGVTVQPDGKIVVGGSTAVGPSNKVAVLVRYNPDGSLDTTFGTGGKVNFSGAPSFRKTLLQADGKIVAGNSSIITRFNPDGTLDDGTAADSTAGDYFGTGGFVTGRGMMRIIQPDGKILTAGTSSNGVNDDILLIRLNPDGTTDTGFGIGGEARIDKGSSEAVQGVYPVLAVGPNGSILVVGYQINAAQHSLIARLTPQGMLDSSFAPGGVVVGNFSNAGDFFWAVALQPDGRIVAVGGWNRIITKNSSETDFLVARFQGDPSSPLQAAAVAATPSGEALTQAQLQPILDEASRRWSAAGANVSALQGLDLRIADLGGTTLGLASGNTIWLDVNAAGWGWFVDPTPGDDREFTTPGNQGEQRRMDLLTVVMHEFGHLLGHEHTDSGLMDDTLPTGIREIPTELVDQLFAAS